MIKKVSKMKKAEIVEELESYGIKATLRARKATLVALLIEKREDHGIPVESKENVNGNPTVFPWFGKIIKKIFCGCKTCNCK